MGMFFLVKWDKNDSQITIFPGNIFFKMEIKCPIREMTLIKGIFCRYICIVSFCIIPCYHAFSYPYFPFDVVMSQIKAMAEDVQPMLTEVRDSNLLKEVENLTRSLTQASEDLRLVCKPLWHLYISNLTCMQIHSHTAY